LFGLTMTGVFALIGLLPATMGTPTRTWALVSAATILSLAVVRPAVLAPLNRAWGSLNRAMAAVTNSLVLGIVFFAILTPFGWFRRRQSDPLGLVPNKAPQSYWVDRGSAGRSGDMRRQF
jgi:hypothetical protein